MSTEVKIVYAEVEGQLSEMSHAVEALKTQAEPPIEGNELDVVVKLTELFTRQEQLLVRFQNLLKENIMTTENSVDFMRESDENISTAISQASSGASKVMK